MHRVALSTPRRLNLPGIAAYKLPSAVIFVAIVTTGCLQVVGSEEGAGAACADATTPGVVCSQNTYVFDTQPLTLDCTPAKDLSLGFQPPNSPCSISQEGVIQVTDAFGGVEVAYQAVIECPSGTQVSVDTGVDGCDVVITVDRIPDGG